MNSVTYISINLFAFLLGQWLVTRGHWAGFLVWCMANVYSVLTCVVTGIPETSCLFATYFLVNLASLRAWFTKSQKPRPPNPALITGANASAQRPGRIGARNGCDVVDPDASRVWLWERKKAAAP